MCKVIGKANLIEALIPQWNFYLPFHYALFHVVNHLSVYYILSKCFKIGRLQKDDS